MLDIFRTVQHLSMPRVFYVIMGMVIDPWPAKQVFRPIIPSVLPGFSYGILLCLVSSIYVSAFVYKSLYFSLLPNEPAFPTVIVIVLDYISYGTFYLST
jgi:hypothetical protein